MDIFIVTFARNLSVYLGELTIQNCVNVALLQAASTRTRADYSGYLEGPVRL
jgi:hypothetical protein